ncbi:SGNH/GDSL hydrolase family protein [Humibacter antri]
MIGSGSTYVALGSSFAAGPGLTPIASSAPADAGRSQVNYAHLAAADLGLSLRDVTYSGATSEHLLKQSPTGTPAQIKAVDSATRLVTVTIGGNDVEYIGSLTVAGAPRWLRPLIGGGARHFALPDDSSVDAGFARLAANLATFVEAVRSRAPLAHIVFVDYLTVLPRMVGAAESSVHRRRMPAAALTWGNRVAARLSATQDEVGRSTGAEFLPVGALSVGHHAWSSEPWVGGFRLRASAPFHPTYDGMRAVADLLVARVRGGESP